MRAERVTLVTGASQGIGRAIAVAFGRVGDTVVLAARNRDGLEATASEVEGAGGSAVVHPTDVTDEDSVSALASMVEDRFGALDVLVNNSGIGGPSGRLWEQDLEGWRETIAVNVEGVFLVTKALLPPMVERRRGAVVVIGSISGKRPLFGRSPYTTSKAALVGLTRTLALEAGEHGIRVNLVSPGFVAGPRIDWVIDAQANARGVDAETVRAEFEAEAPLHRLTEAEDVADATVFLASDAARGITGADINVASGAVMY
jgi:NAD(P)-dependent dehydrogenase (short-subunit alcohol dehydrogenase family)